MSQQTVNLGTGPNTGNGDPLRTGGQKINENFTELYGAVGNPNILALSGLIGAADRLPYFTGVGALSLSTLTAYSRQLLALTTAAAWKGASGLNLAKADVGLPLADNTSDLNKPVSTATQTALNGKQPISTNLTALASVTAAADRVPIFTGTTTAGFIPAGVTGKAVLAATSEAAGRSALDLGTVATFPVTTSTTDATQGRILKVGDHGVGGLTLPTVLGSEIDSLNTNGTFYALGGGSNQGSLPFNTNGYLVNTVYATVYVMQMWTQVITNITWTRCSNDGVWGPWSKLITYGTLIGTVSQSGGTPTGAVIERGTTANGEYTKFADGTIDCWALVSDLTHTANTELVSIWTLPTSVLYITVLTGIQMTVRAPSSTQNFGVTKMQASLASATTVQFRTTFTTSQNYSIFLSLKGRWF